MTTNELRNRIITGGMTVTMLAGAYSFIVEEYMTSCILFTVSYVLLGKKKGAIQ